MRRCNSAAPSAPNAGMSRVFARPGRGRRVNSTSERGVAVGMKPQPNAPVQLLPLPAVQARQ